MEDKRKLIEEKVAFLNKAAKAYYQENRELITNQEYDSLYDELEKLEKETGIVLSSSPTVNVGYEAVSYTHLDVYKRQRWLCTSTARLRPTWE